MDGSAIAGAIGKTYVLGTGDVGKSIRVSASYVDGRGTKESVSSVESSAVSDSSNHVPTGSVTIVGTVKQGETLTVTNTLADVDGFGEIGYQWKANGVAIDGATGDGPQLPEAEVGKVISVTANYLDDVSNQESVSSKSTMVSISDTVM